MSSRAFELAKLLRTINGNSGIVDGRDISADGTKLDGIESGATADQTAAEILTAVKTVDGAGTGLDADLLDGNHASAFASSTHSHTITLSGDLSGSGTTSISAQIAANVVTPTELNVSGNGTSGQVLTSNGDGSFSWSTGGGGGITFSKKTTTYTASAGEGIIADTTSAAWTLTLPATPSAGAQVIVADGGSWAVNNLTVGRNGSTIEGVADNYLLDVAGAQVQFIYDGSTWQLYSNPGIVHSGDSIVIYDSTGTVLKTIYSA